MTQSSKVGPVIATKDYETIAIASGVATVSGGQNYTISAETGTTDDLDTLTLGWTDLVTASNTYRPQIIIKADSGDTITVKHETGNISLASGGDFTLTATTLLQLFWDGTNWRDGKSSTGAGEANTASNQAAGRVDVFKQKTGVDLEVYRQAIPIPGGRLTLTTATPVTTSDTTGTTLYYTPYTTGTLALYDGTNWVPFTLTEISITNAGLTADQVYDVFIYDSGGLTLDLTAWSNHGAGTGARATALVRQDGVWVKTGALGRLYIGTIRTWNNGGTVTFADTGSGGVAQSDVARRLVWNMYNRVPRPYDITDDTNSWTHSAVATWRQINNNTNNQLDVVVGLAEDAINPQYTALILGVSGNAATPGIGINSTTAFSGVNQYIASGNTSVEGVIANHKAILPIGYNFVAPIEFSALAVAITWYGDLGLAYLQTGMTGMVMA